MKTIIKIILAGILFLMNNISFADNSNYKLDITNLKYISDRSLEFDIHLMNTGNDKTELKYSLGQYFLDFNPQIANGGTLTYSIISSELAESIRPGNASVYEDQLRLAGNLISQDKNVLPVIAAKPPGLLIAHMKLETSAKKFADVPLNLKWSSGKFRTKIFTYTGTKNVELTNLESNVMDFDNSGNGATQDNTELPKEFSLSQNYPNPFNPSTKISYDIPVSNFVTLRIYDITGREVATLVNEQLNAGRYEATFNGSNVASGVYFYKIQAGSYSSIKRMVLIK